MIRLVVYDLDGTLIDSRGDLADSVNAMLARLGLPEREPRVIQGFIGEGAERLIRRSLGPQHEVEDIVQDVFLCLFGRLHTLRDPVALRAFVIAITVRTARYEIRRARVRRWVGVKIVLYNARLDLRQQCQSATAA